MCDRFCDPMFLYSGVALYVRISLHAVALYVLSLHVRAAIFAYQVSRIRGGWGGLDMGMPLFRTELRSLDLDAVQGLGAALANRREARLGSPRDSVQHTAGKVSGEFVLHERSLRKFEDGALVVPWF